MYRVTQKEPAIQGKWCKLIPVGFCHLALTTTWHLLGSTSTSATLPESSACHTNVDTCSMQAGAVYICFTTMKTLYSCQSMAWHRFSLWTRSYFQQKVGFWEGTEAVSITTTVLFGMCVLPQQTHSDEKLYPEIRTKRHQQSKQHDKRDNKECNSNTQQQQQNNTDNINNSTTYSNRKYNRVEWMKNKQRCLTIWSTQQTNTENYINMHLTTRSLLKIKNINRHPPVKPSSATRQNNNNNNNNNNNDDTTTKMKEAKQRKREEEPNKENSKRVKVRFWAHPHSTPSTTKEEQWRNQLAQAFLRILGACAFCGVCQNNLLQAKQDRIWNATTLDSSLFQEPGGRPTFFPSTYFVQSGSRFPIKIWKCFLVLFFWPFIRFLLVGDILSVWQSCMCGLGVKFQNGKMKSLL